MNGQVVLLAKRDAFSRQAEVLAQIIFGDRGRIFSGAVGDPLPAELCADPPEILLSFLSPWIVPEKVLSDCTLALNFHPGSTHYPGIGCYNFALYEEAATFGAVCHHMLARVDTGTVVEERLFQVLPSDSVETLKFRTMTTMVALFHDITTLIATGKELPVASRQWSRRPFTRMEMEELKRIDADMPADEIRRVLRATTYPGYPGPYVEVGAERFFAPVPDRPPLA